MAREERQNLNRSIPHFSHVVLALYVTVTVTITATKLSDRITDSRTTEPRTPHTQSPQLSQVFRQHVQKHVDKLSEAV